MYTLGMGRSLAVGGGGWQLSVGGCIYFNNLQAARHFFLLHNNNTLQHSIMAISINTTHGSVTNRPDM